MQFIDNLLTIAKSTIKFKTEHKTESVSEANIDLIKNIINVDIEYKTGCKLYNKNNIIELFIDNNNIELLKKNIVLNLIPEIDFNYLFKSSCGLGLVFKNDNVLLYHNNTQIYEKDIKDYVYKNIITTYEHPELFMETIVTILEKFVKKDLSVKYNCLNIPLPYWKLFEIKCIRNNPDAMSIYSKYSIHEDIVSGNIYKITSVIDNHININEDIETDNYIRMEVFSYLGDEELDHFLNSLERYEKCRSSYEELINVLIEIINNSENKMIKFYYINKFFKIIPMCLSIIANSNINDNITSILNEFLENIYIVQSAGLKLSDEIIMSYTHVKDYLNTNDSIEDEI